MNSRLPKLILTFWRVKILQVSCHNPHFSRIEDYKLRFFLFLGAHIEAEILNLLFEGFFKKAEFYFKDRWPRKHTDVCAY